MTTLRLVFGTWLLTAGLAGARSPHPVVIGFERFAAAEQGSAEGGRLLLAELGCTACHRTPNGRLAAKRGPVLDGAGDRLRPAWLRQYLSNPAATKPGTTMPHLLASLAADEARRQVQHLVAYLSSLRDEAQFAFDSTAGQPILPEFWNKGDAGRGRQLYHQVGCVACHAPDEDYEVEVLYPSDLEKLRAQFTPEELEELGIQAGGPPVPSVPLGPVAEKYDRRSLVFFLLDPLRYRPSGRMPSLGLSHSEAADLAAYLVPDRRPVEPLSVDRALAAAGREDFVRLGCARCHTVQGVSPADASRPLRRLSANAPRACTTADTRPGQPQFVLSDTQQQALGAALAAVRSNAPNSPDASNGGPPDGAWIDGKMRQLNCYACHGRGGRGGVGPERWRYFETVRQIDMGDEGRMPPPLDGVGDKLKPAWLAKAVQGQVRVRPYMRARMPRFGAANVAGLAERFAHADRGDRPGGDPFARLTAPADAGRQLLDAGCVQCHPLRGERLPGVMGIDLAHPDQRLHADWFQRFVLNPVALKPRTRMPTFFPNGRSPHPAVLDGDVPRQIAAMWNYLKSVDRQPLPPKLVANKAFDFELKPTARPILLRTFLKRAGTHGIAVGFPAGVHFSFDAEHPHPVQVWRGRFLDAHGTWYDRFTPLAEPLGEPVAQLPDGPVFATLEDAGQAWPDASASKVRFRGYRLDDTRTPTFLYRGDGFEVADRLAPSAGGGRLLRTIRVTRPDTPGAGRLWFRLLTGARVGRLGETAFQNDAGLVVAVPPAWAAAARHVAGEPQEWRVPLPERDDAMLEVEYRWQE